MTARKALDKVEFWSSVEYAGFGRALIGSLQSQEVSAELKFELSQAKYWSATNIGKKLRLRLRAYIIYPLRLALCLGFSKRPLLAVVSSNTFYAPFVATLVLKRHAKLVNWVLDLYPDVLVLNGNIRRGGSAYMVLAWLARWTMSRSAVNVFLGKSLLTAAQARYGPIRNPVVIPIGADGRPFRGRLPVERAGGLKILYSGNMGRMHDVATVASAIVAGIPAGISLVFRSSGAGYDELKRLLREHKQDSPRNTWGTQLELGQGLGSNGWVEEMLSADVALVTLLPGAEQLVIPSKTYSAMVAGQAILAIASRQSDLATIVQEHNCGWVVEPGDVGGLRRTLEDIVSNRQMCMQKRRASYEAGHKYFDQEVLATNWKVLLNSLGSQSTI
jgi:glycosyltransferase involved in cell wall biosynthesis